MKKLLLLLSIVFITIQSFGQATGYDLSNFASSGSIGTASTTVDVYSRINIIQTTPSISLTVPKPTNTTTKVTEVWITNKGTASFNLRPLPDTSVFRVDTGQCVILKWVGAKYSVVGKGSAVDLSGYMPKSGGTFTGNVNGVTPTELGYVAGATSNIQTQINGKQATFGSQSANLVYRSGNSGGVPTFSALTIPDLPAIAAISTNVATVTAGDSYQTVVNKLQSQVTDAYAYADFLKAKSIRQGRFSNRTSVAFGSRMPWLDGFASDAVITTATSRLAHRSQQGVSEISLFFLNFESIRSAVLANTNDITIEASIEYPAGTFTRVTFNSGSTSALVKYGQYLESDPVSVIIPNNTVFWTRTNVLVTAGQKWIYTHQTYSTYNSEGVVVGSNSVMSGTITTSNTRCFGPSLILGTQSTNKKCVYLVGDSLSVGLGDDGSGIPNLGSGISGGIFYRAFSYNYPVIQGNVPGQALANYRTNGGRKIFPFMSACEAMICELGVNDIKAGVTFATLQADYVYLWDLFFAKGVPVYQTTITPVSKSTDGWVTTGNQTTDISNPVRVNVNNWIRDGAPMYKDTRLPAPTGSSGSNIIRMGSAYHPVVKYYEIADLVETARDSGIWKAGYTTDGLHGVPTSYAIMSAAITLSDFNK